MRLLHIAVSHVRAFRLKRAYVLHALATHDGISIARIWAKQSPCLLHELATFHSILYKYYINNKKLYINWLL